MKKLHILLFSFFIVFVASAQENLLPNPGFEEYLSCYDTVSKDSSRIVKHWSNPIDKEALPSNLCEEGGANFIKAIESRTGSAVQYLLIWYNDPRNIKIDNRSYLIAHLKKPLIENGTYFFRMYTRCIFNTLQGFSKANGQGIAFSKLPPKVAVNNGQIQMEAAFQSEKIIDTFWTEISGCFRAKGGEEYAVLGNFKTKNNTLVKELAPKSTTTTPIDPNIDPNLINNATLASYIIDDVELISLNAPIPKDTAICEGDILDLNVKTNLQATYKWQDGTTTPQYRVMKGGIYTVSMTYSINGSTCVMLQSIKVKVLPRYIPKQYYDTVVCSFKNILLKVGTRRHDDTIRWQDNSFHDTLRVNRNGIYEAQISNSCGTYAETFKVSFVNCIINIYVPNIFSPNGDNQNDTFAPFIHAEFPIVDYEFAIFNRWGSQVFFSQNRDETWDATFKNKPLENGVYIWYLTVKGNINGKIVKEMEGGSITLIR